MISQSKHVKHLSNSSLTAYLNCPRLWYYRYVMKPQVSVRARMILGRCYHEVIAHAALRRQLFNEQLDVRRITREFSLRWDKEVEERTIYDDEGNPQAKAPNVDFADESPRDLKRAGLELTIRFILEVLPTLPPIEYIEQRFAADVDGIPYIGYIDMGFKGGDIADHKLRTRRMTQEQADLDLQPTSYALLTNRPINFHFYQALDQKKGKVIEPITTKRGMTEIAMLRTIIKDAWRGINEDYFYRNPTCKWCGPGCSYYLDCLHPNF